MENKRKHRWREISRENIFPGKIKIVYQCIDCPLKIPRIYKENEEIKSPR